MATGKSELISPEIRHRVQHAWAACAVKGGMHCISIYLKDSVGISANLDILLEVAALVKTIDGPWIIGGDFNATPQAMANANWPQVLGGTIIAPCARPR